MSNYVASLTQVIRAEPKLDTPAPKPKRSRAKTVRMIGEEWPEFDSTSHEPTEADETDIEKTPFTEWLKRNGQVLEAEIGRAHV